MNEEMMGVNETVETQPIESAANSQIETNEEVQESTQEQQQENTTFNNEGVEQAFAKRLAKEREKLESQYNPYKSFVESAAKEYNMTPEQYLQAIEDQKREQERQSYIDKGVDPDLVNQLIESNPEVQYARQIRQQQEQERKFNSEAQELFSAYPDINPKDIPNEVFQLREQTGMPLIYAYKAAMFDNVAKQTEQKVLKSLQSNAQSSPGALGVGTEHKTGYTSLSAAEKKSLRDRVLRGENIQI